MPTSKLEVHPPLPAPQRERRKRRLQALARHRQMSREREPLIVARLEQVVDMLFHIFEGQEFPEVMRPTVNRLIWELKDKAAQLDLHFPDVWMERRDVSRGYLVYLFKEIQEQFHAPPKPQPGVHLVPIVIEALRRFAGLASLSQVADALDKGVSEVRPAVKLAEEQALIQRIGGGRSVRYQLPGIEAEVETPVGDAMAEDLAGVIRTVRLSGSIPMKHIAASLHKTIHEIRPAVKMAEDRGLLERTGAARATRYRLTNLS